MSASILDGQAVAKQIKQQLKRTLAAHLQQGYRAAALAVILIGDNPASILYVNSKRSDCSDIGMQSCVHHLAHDTTQVQLIELIQSLNNNPTIDGILVQLPLPSHIDTQAIVECIAPDKDVDGFHPINLGKLAQGTPFLRPCTPHGIMQLLSHYQLDVRGQHAVVIGASTLVGRPMALELLMQKATVTVCHSASTHLERHVRCADMVIVATGVMDVISPTWFNSEQIIVDVGIHHTTQGLLRGDIDFKIACQNVAWITPVPGGVGPMTRCALLQNTVMAYGTHLT